MRTASMVAARGCRCDKSMATGHSALLRPQDPVYAGDCGAAPGVTDTRHTVYARGQKRKARLEVQAAERPKTPGVPPKLQQHVIPIGMIVANPDGGFQWDVQDKRRRVHEGGGVGRAESDVAPGQSCTH